MYCLAKHIRSTHRPESGTVLDIERGTMFRLNASGSKILEMVKQGLGAEEIAETIANRFGCSIEVATSNVGEFLQSLREHAVIEDR